MDYEIGIPAYTYENLEYIIPLLVILLGANWWFSRQRQSENKDDSE